MILQQLVQIVSVIYLITMVSFSVFLKYLYFYLWGFFLFWNVRWCYMSIPYFQVTGIFIYSFIFPCYYHRPLFRLTASLMLVLHQQFLWLQEHCLLYMISNGFVMLLQMVFTKFYQLNIQPIFLFIVALFVYYEVSDFYRLFKGT